MLEAVAYEEKENGLEVYVSDLRCAVEVFYEFASFAVMLERPVKAGALADVDRLLSGVIEVLMEVRGFYIDVSDVEVVGSGDGE